LLNVVTGARGYPAAVLIRGSEDHLGPGILTKALGVDGSFNGTLLSPKNRLWIEPREGDGPTVRSGPRVGVDYAGEHWAKVPYRFWFSKG
jgi:DNA-3-methyladenine glycosylase